jgi:hypothetical protein
VLWSQCSNPEEQEIIVILAQWQNKIQGKQTNIMVQVLIKKTVFAETLKGRLEFRATDNYKS